MYMYAPTRYKYHLCTDWYNTLTFSHSYPVWYTLQTPNKVGALAYAALIAARHTIPRKRSYPFNKDVPRKKRKTERYVNVRIYVRQKDLEHMNEIECALMPDGGLDLVGLCQKLNLEGCQASWLNVIPICGLGHAYYPCRFWTLTTHDHGLASAPSWIVVRLDCWEQSRDTYEW